MSSVLLSPVAPVVDELMAPYYVNWPYVINLSNSIIGVSVLALPYCFRECGVILGLLLLVASGWLAQKTCHMLMKTAFAAKKRSYEYLASYVFGRMGKLIVEISIIGMLIGQCIAFYVIIGDLGPAIIAKMTGLENTPILRSIVMSLLAVFVALPLGMLDSLDRLSGYSAASLTFYSLFILQVLYTALPNLWSGVWLAKVVFWNPEGIFKCLPIFALSFSCHTQLFIIYDALPEASVSRMRSIIRHAVGLCTVMYILVGYFGYVAFCDEEISGDILMSFRQTWFNDFIKLGFVMSTVISFPLVIYPCRASIYTLIFAKNEKTLHDNIGGAVYIPVLHFKLITACIIALTLIVGILVPNVEFILALTGATMGSLICYVLPAAMFLTFMTLNKGQGRLIAQLVLFVGVTIFLASTFVTIGLQHEQSSTHQESVVKVGQPIEHKEDNLAAKAIESEKKTKEETALVLENKRSAAVDAVNGSEFVASVVNSSVSSSTRLPAKKQNLVAEEREKRQEPPNPQAPADDILHRLPEEVHESNRNTSPDIQVDVPPQKHDLINQDTKLLQPNNSNLQFINKPLEPDSKHNEKRDFQDIAAVPQLDKLAVPEFDNKQLVVGPDQDVGPDHHQAPPVVVVKKSDVRNAEELKQSQNETIVHENRAQQKLVDEKQVLHLEQQFGSNDARSLLRSDDKLIKLKRRDANDADDGHQHRDDIIDKDRETKDGRAEEEEILRQKSEHYNHKEPGLRGQDIPSSTNVTAASIDIVEGKETESKNLRPEVTVNALREEIRNVVKDEAKDILIEMKKQQEEHRKLLDEQKKIISEMVQHQKEVHEDEQGVAHHPQPDTGEKHVQELQQQQQQQVQFEQLPQQVLQQDQQRSDYQQQKQQPPDIQQLQRFPQNEENPQPLQKQQLEPQQQKQRQSAQHNVQEQQQHPQHIVEQQEPAQRIVQQQQPEKQQAAQQQPVQQHTQQHERAQQKQQQHSDREMKNAELEDNAVKLKTVTSVLERRRNIDSR